MQESILIPLSLVFAYLAILVVIAEKLNKLGATDTELTRKVVHIGSGNVILIAWWFGIPALPILIASGIASCVALLSYALPILPSINSVGRKSLGTFFYALSIGILTAAFWSTMPKYTVIGILTMTWGDGLAALIGQRFGTHKYQIWGISKSWEGSLAMFLSSYFIIVLIFANTGVSWQIVGITGIVALVATALEALSKLGVDNLTVPLGSAFLAYYLCDILLHQP